MATTHAAASKRRDSGNGTAQAAREVHVLGHDGHALGVDGAEHGVLEQMHLRMRPAHSPQLCTESRQQRLRLQDAVQGRGTPVIALL